MTTAARTAVLLALAALLAPAACERQPPGDPAPSTSPAPAQQPLPHTAPSAPPSPTDSDLAVELTDLTGTLVARGHIRLPAVPALLPEGEFEGAWSFERAADELTAPDTRFLGEGSYRGYRDGTNVLLDLHPGVVDANHLLTFQVEGARLVGGQWQFESDAGPQRVGACAVITP